ncbi:hemogen isoform X2 [Stigmatopora argus]
MEGTLEKDVECKRQNEEEQGGIGRRLRDRELLKRRRAEAEEKETYQSESPKKRRKYERRRSNTKRGRPKKTENLEAQLADPVASTLVVVPPSVDAIPALALGSPSAILEPVSTWLPNPVLAPDNNVAPESPADLVPSTFPVPEGPVQEPSCATDIYPPPTTVVPTAGQVLDTSSAPDISPVPTAELPDESSSQEQVFFPDSDTIHPLGPSQKTSPALVSAPDLVPPPTTVPPAPSTQASSAASVQNFAPDVVPAQAADVVLAPTPSTALVSEEVAPSRVPQRLENLDTESEGIEELDPDELKKDAPPIQDTISDKEMSENLSNEPEQDKMSTIVSFSSPPQDSVPGSQF